MSPNYRHAPIFDPERKRCPVCHHSVYSLAGIHPQCAKRLDDPPKAKNKGVNVAVTAEQAPLVDQTDPRGNSERRITAQRFSATIPWHIRRSEDRSLIGGSQTVAPTRPFRLPHSRDHWDRTAQYYTLTDTGLSAFQDREGRESLTCPERQNRATRRIRRRLPGGSSVGNPLAWSTPFSDQENQEKHISSGQAETFSRLVIPFYINFGYTSIGWSDDRVNTLGSPRITFCFPLSPFPPPGLLCVPLSHRPRKQSTGRKVFDRRRLSWERNCMLEI